MLEKLEWRYSREFFFKGKARKKEFLARSG